MTQQRNFIRGQCQGRIKRGPSKGRCIENATIGTYQWASGETDVNLDKPVAIFCGRHKPNLSRNVLLRNVKLRRR